MKNEEEIWQEIRQYAQETIDEEPDLASTMHMYILMHDNLAESILSVITDDLKTPMYLQGTLTNRFRAVLKENPDIMKNIVQDLQSYVDRDPACDDYGHALLDFKGFQVTVAQRLAHAVWSEGKKKFPYFLQNRMSKVYGVDFHPAAEIGSGFMFDHATGAVIGETAIIGKNVSMLHNVTLGGTGTETGHKRHPTIGDGVLLGAGCKVLGNIKVGDSAKVAASSVVLKDVGELKVVAGIPAKPVGEVVGKNPSERMRHDNLGDKFENVAPVPSSSVA